MADKDTPRSILQAFIENVPTTAPIKRSRSRTKSPEENKTIPSQKKRPRRHSSISRQTPRSMIETYMHGHKTKTPFIQTSRPGPRPAEDPSTQMVTPRTALEGFLNEASEEIPFEIPEGNDSEGSFQIPNETINITQSPLKIEKSVQRTIKQKEIRRNHNHITLQHFLQGIHNAANVNSAATLQTNKMEISSKLSPIAKVNSKPFNIIGNTESVLTSPRTKWTSSTPLSKKKSLSVKNSPQIQTVDNIEQTPIPDVTVGKSISNKSDSNLSTSTNKHESSTLESNARKSLNKVVQSNLSRKLELTYEPVTLLDNTKSISTKTPTKNSEIQTTKSLTPSPTPAIQRTPISNKVGSSLLMTSKSITKGLSKYSLEQKLDQSAFHRDDKLPEEVDDSGNSDLEDTSDDIKLKTPHLHGNISRIPTPIYSSTPAPVRTKQNIESHVKISKKKPERNMISSIIPTSVIKQAFQHFSNMRAAPNTMNELIKFTDKYFENTSKNLENYALHAGRKTIDESDVILMMKRQGFITDKQPLDIHIENILPLEMRQEIVPMATAFNILTPY